MRLGSRRNEWEILGSGRRPVRLSRAGERHNAELLVLVGWMAKTDIDHDPAIKDTRAWAIIELPILIRLAQADNLNASGLHRQH